VFDEREFSSDWRLARRFWSEVMTFRSCEEREVCAETEIKGVRRSMRVRVR